jgi:hypothetical protein
MKKCYIISYSLKMPSVNDASIIHVIKTSKNWTKINDATYIITSSLTAPQIRDALMKLLKPGDKLYISLLGNQAGWCGLDSLVSTWLQKNQK